MVKEIPAHYSNFLSSEDGLLAFILFLCILHDSSSMQGSRRTSPVNRRIGDLSPDPCTSEWCQSMILNLFESELNLVLPLSAEPRSLCADWSA
ncbi:hypothetical protein C8J55DRAFT_98533 [Lentinula edodes]|uniref:Uncharacterized protein n=1 Tax=Lentinula lateritia TaxID=40482 RepID=A0A9W9E0J4_9AGAR|nr:hypothetical protein C8J55DRAFT_98533 [Lentinula edodes]